MTNVSGEQKAEEMTTSDSDLVVSFCGESIRLVPGRELTFGREADLIIDTDRRLHRLLGRFRFERSFWWLDNVGSAIPLKVTDLDSWSSSELAPGATAALTFGRARLRFGVGDLSFAIDIESGAPSLAPPVPLIEDSSSPTLVMVNVPLTADQKLILVALSELALLDPSPTTQVPPSRRAARRLGWSITTFNRKLDNVCDKYSRAGVAGLKGDTGALASGRRQKLVEHVVRNGVVRVEDLASLAPPA